MTNPMKNKRTVSVSHPYSYKVDSHAVCKPSIGVQIKPVVAKDNCNQSTIIDFSIIEIDWNGVKEQSERIQKHFQEGGKPEELSEIKFIKPFSL